ncbi:MAG: nicotinate-nucleotide adenylyltransferase, partial [Nitrospinota bacterium]|nr:nicotinate-nucleotide adenylyltransferase [Nitrospinota bacterium]
MRVGILGGTFNPIHFGHIYPTSEAARKLNLDKVLFIPAYSPPHKPDGEIISAHHRKNLIKLAIEDYPYFELSPLEIDRKGISYSVDTVSALRKKDDSFFFIIGLDAFLEIDTWKEADRLLKSCNFIVVTRDEPVSDQS